MKNNYPGLYEENELYSELYYHAVTAKVYGVEIPDDLPIKKISGDTAKYLKARGYSQLIEKLLFLYGAGVIDDDMFNIIADLETDIFSEIQAAEKFLIEQENRADADRLDAGQLKNIILCTVVSRKYKELVPVSFEDAHRLAGLNHVIITDGFVKITDYDYYKFLAENGEIFGTIEKDKSIKTNDTLENLLDRDVIQPENIDKREYPFMADPKKLIYYSAVCDKKYGLDFILYAKENKTALNENFYDEYEKYLYREKFHFVVSCYNKKRDVCGDYVNWFDYASAPETDNNISAEFTKEIDLNVSDDLSDDELLSAALDKVTGDKSVKNKAVFEIVHGRKAYWYLLDENSLVKLDSDEFHRQLFDFNKIWSVFKEFSRKNSIKAVGGVVEIPNEVISEVEEKDRFFAENLIKEQYARTVEHRKSNKLLKSLSDLKSAAAEAKSKEKLIKQQQAALAESQAAQGSSLEEMK